MFATVKHEDGELKINPNCYIRIIYDYIREQLSIPADRDFDLYSEDGSACFIYRHPPDTDGKTVLTPRRTYRLEVFRIDGDLEMSRAPDELPTTPPSTTSNSSSHTSSVQDAPQDVVNQE